MKVLNLSTFGGRTVVLCCRGPHPASSKKNSALKINEWIFNLDTEYRAANGSSVCVLCAVSISMAGKLSSSWQSQISVTVLRISNVGVWLQTTFCWFIEHFVSLCFDVEIFSGHLQSWLSCDPVQVERDLPTGLKAVFREPIVVAPLYNLRSWVSCSW